MKYLLIVVMLCGVLWSQQYVVSTDDYTIITQDLLIEYIEWCDQDSTHYYTDEWDIIDWENTPDSVMWVKTKTVIDTIYYNPEPTLRVFAEWLGKE